MQRVVFLVQNGIGFGHIRRTLLIAKEIQISDPSIEVIFISQANSLLLFQKSPFPVINFPFFHRLPNNASEHAYRTLLHEILADLKPTIVVEDTYPDPWYLSIPVLQDIPKILIMRRINPLAFDEFRRQGYFSTYDCILMIQEEQDFFAERPVRESELLVKLTNKFHFVGPVFNLPNDIELSEIRKKYPVDTNPVVVVSAGAGGNYLNDTYCEQLFTSMRDIALRCLQSGIPAHFVLVLGPYYRGPRPEILPNMTVVDYEPMLSALLHLASIAVIRPGFNVTYETLSGLAEVILVPGISYMEAHYHHSQQLKERYKISVGSYDDVDQLFELIKELLQRSASGRPRNPIIPNQDKVANIIIQEMNRFKEETLVKDLLKNISLYLLVGQIPDEHSKATQALLRKVCPQIAQVTTTLSGDRLEDIPNLDILMTDIDQLPKLQQEVLPFIFLHASKLSSLTREMLVERGVKVAFYTSRVSFGIKAKQWCRYYPLGAYGILEKELYHFQVSSQWRSRLSYHVSKLLHRTEAIAIYLDLHLLTQKDELVAFCSDLSKWLSATQCRVQTTTELVNSLVLDELAPMPEEYEPEIEKLS